MGGLETHLNEVAPRIARAGFEVTILTTDRTGLLPTAELRDGVRIERVRAYPSRSDYYFAPAIYRRIRQGKWDLLHCHAYQTLVPPLAMLAAARSGIPFVVTFHSGGHGSRLRNRFRSTQLRLLSPLLRHARRLIAVSEFEASTLPARLGVPASRFVIIPNGAEIELPADQPAPAEDPGLVLSVGRLERYKGHHLVIAALPHVLADIPDIHLLIVGSGPYEAELRRLAESYEVADRVEIRSIPPTDRSGMASTVARAGLVTLLSAYEGNPVSVMEALALRRRVLVADTSGLSELGRRGLAHVIPLDSSPTAIARAIVEQLRSPAPADFRLPTWDGCAAKLVELYRDVLTG
ncbi:MAG: glycosyltransferase family 4 protein [Chloroflexota bacterium]